MGARDPKTLYLPFWLGGEFNLAKLLAADDRWSGSQAFRLLEQFELRSHERAFVKRILERRTNLWLFRCNQRHWCGDFIVVDMSAPAPADRRAWVIELKSGEPLVLGGARHQCAKFPLALAEIAERTGSIDAATPVEQVYGSAEVVLTHLGL